MRKLSKSGELSPTQITYIEDKPHTLNLRKVRLVIQPGDSSEVAQVFEQEHITLGTRPDSDVVLDDPAVSRTHCCIAQGDRHYLIRDQDSTNGTFVNGVRIREAYLAPGQVIALGNSHVRFHPFDERVKVKPLEEAEFGRVIGKSDNMRRIFSIIDKISPTGATVVLEGETGTGKEVVARTIHEMSRRADKPFVVVDCGAIPQHLIESELFGHEKGSFTGATVTRKGLFEMAQGGTVFLDELGELNLELQPKLLRVLEQREIRRVGANRAVPVDVRVIAATNRDLKEEVAAGRFREDLFYRLSVLRIVLPSLRERIEDVPLLVEHFLRTMPFNRTESDTVRIRQIQSEALEALLRHPWPGNVRELINVIERACSFCDSQTIGLSELPDAISGLSTGLSAQESQDKSRETGGWSELPHASALQAKPFKEAKEEWITVFERDYVIELLGRHRGNISHAARTADIDRKYFKKLMDKYGIDAADFDNSLSTRHS